MNIIIRIFYNIACIMMALWLICESIPVVILTYHAMSREVWYATITCIGLADLIVIVLLFVAVNLLVTG